MIMYLKIYIGGHYYNKIKPLQKKKKKVYVKHIDHNFEQAYKLRSLVEFEAK
jgi:hypothetical protein